MDSELGLSIATSLVIMMLGYFSTIIVRISLPFIKEGSPKDYNRITESSVGNHDQFVGFLTYSIYIGFSRYIIFHDNNRIIPIYTKILFISIELVALCLFGFLIYINT